ncbi:hypothetical protein H0H81_010259 [Sphagnurus paluster]|uniref:DUF7330 domain-containing protein n=1 Tax=Sphagnurus paluster TaxID=117069 RepID=A0A9P7KJS0_9AGAR|nr:hypothetical protein H0H81_010259 [Sphagnurus paluster]
MIIINENANLISKGANTIPGRQGGSSEPPPSYQATGGPIPPQPPTEIYVVRQDLSYRKSPGVWKGEFPVPTNIALSHCPSNEEWTPSPPDYTSDYRYPYASSASFELPLSHKTLFFMSRGSQTGGILNMVTSREKSDVAKVHVTVKYHNKYVRDEGVKVCLIKRSEDEIGVGFFTRQWYGPDHGIYYEATVVLPESGKLDRPLHIENFETDVPNTVHKIGALRVDVGVHNDQKYVSDLVMRTSNGKIDSRVSLTSPYEGGRYLVTAASSNGPVTVRFPTSPLDSVLKLSASTSNSPAFVSLDPAYEGSLALSTSNFSPLLQRRNTKDPAGKGRTRHIKVNSYGRSVLKGSVSWSGWDGSGTVEVNSSNSPVTLEI